MGKYQKVREVVRDMMKDGNVHTAEEMEKMCEMRGVNLYQNRGPIYNIVHQLKQKGEIISDGENGYVSTKVEQVNTISNIKGGLHNIEEINLSDFEVVKSAVRRKTKQVISVFENGDIAINDALKRQLGVNEIEIRIRRDCRQIVLIPDGTEKIELGKNSRFKNYEIYEKIKGRKVKFPVYYVGEWNVKNNFWLGEMTMTNPNKTFIRNIKKE